LAAHYVRSAPTPIYHANLSVGCIQLPKGRYKVRFTYDAPGFVRGLPITLLAVLTLLTWIVGCLYVERRSGMYLGSPQ